MHNINTNKCKTHNLNATQPNQHIINNILSSLDSNKPTPNETYTSELDIHTNIAVLGTHTFIIEKKVKYTM